MEKIAKALDKVNIAENKDLENQELLALLVYNRFDSHGNLATVELWIIAQIQDV